MLHQDPSTPSPPASVMPATVTTKGKLALRKKEERAHTTALWARLELLAPNVDEDKTQPRYRSKAVAGRTKDQLLKDVMHAVQQAHGSMAPGALQQAFTTQAGAGLIAIELKSGKIAHQSLAIQDLTRWIPPEARGNIRVLLESRDGDDFHGFCQSAVRDAGEPYSGTFLDVEQVVGRSITVRFLTRAPGPQGLRNPDWLLMIRALKLTLVGVQLAGDSPAAGRRLPFFGQARLPEAIGVFTVDLSGGMPQQWTLQVAHVRYLLDMEVGSGTYDVEVGNIKPLEIIAALFQPASLNEAGGCATSALNLAQRSAMWLTSKALGVTIQWPMRLNDDDTVSLSHLGLYTLFGGFSTSISISVVAGKVGFSHGGLEFMFFFADPAQPLDGNLRATWVRVPAAKTAGELELQRPFVISGMWGGGVFQAYCKMLSMDLVGTKRVCDSPAEDVSQLLEELRVSPGVSLASDGANSICIGQSDVSVNSSPNL